jgi:branched-chain amino acid transport system substrate-binding protein
MVKHAYAPQAEGFRLYMQSVNDRGGIKGHPVKVSFEDDKSSPARSGAIATKLILEDKVLAICGLSFSISHPPVYKLAKEHQVPVVVAYSCVTAAWAPVENDAKYIFAAGQTFHPKGLTGVVGYSMVLKNAFPQGTTFGSMSYTSPGGRLTSIFVKNSLEKQGLKCIYHEDIPAGTVDITPWAQKVAKANPGFLALNFAGEIVVPMMAALEKYGYKGVIVLPDFLSEGDFKKAIDGLMKPTGNILLHAGAESPAGDVIVPAHTEIKKAMKKYGSKYTMSMNHTLGWIVARIMEQALKKSGWRATRESVFSALEMTSADTQGLTPGPITFSPEDHSGPKYSKLYKWDPDKKSLATAVDWVTYYPRKVLPH